MISFHTPTNEKIWNEVTQFLVKKLKERPEKKLVFLSGGSITRLYEKVGEAIRIGAIDSSSLAFAQGDERFQPRQNSDFGFQNSDKSNINAEVIGETGLWDVCKEKRIPYHLISQEGTVESAAIEYNETIARLLTEYPYRIALLGIGEDGHTAGLLPGYQKMWDTDRFAVGYENKGLYKERISVTPTLLKLLDQALIVALGEKKREALEKVFKKENRDNIDTYPAALLRTIQKVDLFTDIHLPSLLQ